jgi:hypothetical protein
VENIGGAWPAQEPPASPELYSAKSCRDFELYLIQNHPAQSYSADMLDGVDVPHPA